MLPRAGPSSYAIPRWGWLAAGALLLGLGPACSSGSTAHAPSRSGRFEDLPETSCTITLTGAEPSPHIATVGIVTFTTNLAHVRAAEVSFGPDDLYGLVAPVELGADGHRTLLLGMTQNRTYHFRIAVSDGASVCYGEDRTIETGSLNSAALAETFTSEAAAKGFIVTARDGDAVIYDKAGELVWAFPMPNVFSARMSWDGKFMLGRDAGPFDLGYGGSFFRVGMDGSDPVVLDAPGGDHHDFTAIPGGIAYLAKADEGECDKVYEASDDITDGVPVIDTWDIYRYFPDEGSVEGTARCHANRIHYSDDGESYTVSDRNKDAIAIFTRAGLPVLSVGKPPTSGWVQHIQADGAGPGGDWHVQHGHDRYAEDKLVVFSNESIGGAAVLHYTLGDGRARLDWKYAGAGASLIQGDIERLTNGNFLVTANLSGTIVEIEPASQTEVGRYVLGGPMGPAYGFTYSSHRAELYGPPVRR
jgi:hypothetical protein